MTQIYAKIDMTNPGGGVGTVVDIQVLDQSGDNLDPNFTWVNISNLIPTPTVGWTYNGSVFISNAPQPTLQQLQASLTQNLTSDLFSFLASHYSADVRADLAIIYAYAAKNNHTNQLNAVTPVLAWLKSVYGYYLATLTQINALVSVGAAQSFTYNFAANVSADPGLNIGSISQMTN